MLDMLILNQTKCILVAIRQNNFTQKEKEDKSRMKILNPNWEKQLMNKLKTFPQG